MSGRSAFRIPSPTRAACSRRCFLQPEYELIPRATSDHYGPMRKSVVPFKAQQWPVPPPTFVRGRKNVAATGEGGVPPQRPMG